MSAKPARVRVGVIGCGVIAYWTHLRELGSIPGVQLLAACDPDPAARERAAKLSAVRTYADSDELLAQSDIDAVIISAPTHLHAQLGSAAAQARKHFYLEKPIAITAAEGGQLIAAAKESGVHAAAGFNRRCHPLFIQAKELISGGAIGKVRSVFTAFTEPIATDVMPTWKRLRSTGGGVLLDLFSHHADLLRWFLEDEAASVEAKIDSISTEGDEARVGVLMGRGVAAQSYFSFRVGRSDFMEFIGELGTLRVDRHRPALDLRLARRWGYGVRGVFVPPNKDVAWWRMRRLASPSYEPSYRIALKEFVKGIRGQDSRGASLLDGLRSLQIVLGAEESARTERPVNLLG
ncbi:MAG: Gfo/Idh/MocA family oxidoreductase [Acidobacteria bacterium]|nr:Gfo/Idh/MocA family oxidoreductase [Acidobacteriota bacterium]MDA1234610.1 Gfo/Idh/MocA family oxidoreductase [Acidobacteriota bacterium]